MTDQGQSPQRPDWLDDEFVRTCIKNDIGASSTDAIHINDVKLQYVVPKGENFLSLILRITVNYSLDNAVNGETNGVDVTNEKRYIIKITRVMESMKDYYEDHGIYFREVDTYTNLFPTFQNILNKVGLETKFSSRCFNVLNEHGVIVMEDLGAQNYILASRIKGADLEHTKVVFRKLARLHAASMRYYEQHGFEDTPAYYFKGLIRRVEDERIFQLIEDLIGPSVVLKGVNHCANDLKNRPGYEQESDLMSGLADHAFDILCDAFAYKPGNPFNCFLHGDCWINNMLFKYDGAGLPTDVLLCDLQMTCVGSIGNEFTYFFLSSTSDDVRQNHYNDVVDFYLNNLIEALNIVGYKGKKPTLEQLHDELLTSSSMFLMHVPMFLPMLKAETKGEDLDRSETEGSGLEEFHAKSDGNRKNPNYLNTLFITMDLLKKNGVLRYHAEMLEKRNKSAYIKQ